MHLKTHTILRFQSFGEMLPGAEVPGSSSLPAALGDLKVRRQAFVFLNYFSTSECGLESLTSTLFSASLGMALGGDCKWGCH